MQKYSILKLYQEKMYTLQPDSVTVLYDILFECNG